MKKKFTEWHSMMLEKNPRGVVLGSILLFNLVFVLLSSLVLSRIYSGGTKELGFFEAMFYTMTMILDPGSVAYLIDDVGTAGFCMAVVCLVIIIVGMVSFTGAVIGYLTGVISEFVESASSGSTPLHFSDHMVIINWNSRGAGIVSDLLYCPGQQKVVILCPSGKDEIEREINERITATLAAENSALRDECCSRGFFGGRLKYLRRRMKNNIFFVVREGSIFSSAQLNSISLLSARSVIILDDSAASSSAGNAQTIKTLMIVSDITASAESSADQEIIVEVQDEWTLELVERIKRNKQVDSKCAILPVRVNVLMGDLLAQFSVMPELNMAYRELFSNKGATFYVREETHADDISCNTEFLRTHRAAIPLSSMRSDGRDYFFYCAGSMQDLNTSCDDAPGSISVKLNHDFHIPRRKIVILGHNSKLRNIMHSFVSFSGEWDMPDGTPVLDIMVIDSRQALDAMNNYRDFPFVTRTVTADIFDEDVICSSIGDFLGTDNAPSSILVLSDDTAEASRTDADVLTLLIYIQNLLTGRRQHGIPTENIDIIAEIIDPAHLDIVSSYSINNVVISNRFVSNMINQMSEKIALFDFYCDILTYDEPGIVTYESKELYVKNADDFFLELPPECSEGELIRGVWEASTHPALPASGMKPALVLGWIDAEGHMRIFSGDQDERRVRLTPGCKLLVFTNH